MSIKAVSWALNDVKCSPDYKMILIALAERADDHGVTFPTQVEIAQKTCIALRTLKRRMKRLESEGVMVVITQQVKTNLRRNTYRLRIEERFDLLDKRPVDSENNGANLTPLPEGPEIQDGANLSPIMVPDGHHSEGRWCHPGGTQDGATLVAHKPPYNHQNNNSNSTAAGADGLFSPRPPSGQDRITMSLDWRPSPHIIETLNVTRGIDPDFCEDCLPDFVEYHNGASNRQGAFNAKFRAHVLVNHEKRKYQPKPLPAGWQPDQQTIQRLVLAGVGVDFIWDGLPEFELYWRERGTPEHGWNGKFYSHITRCWQQHKAQMESSRKLHSPLERMADRSWADSPETIRRLA